MYARYDYNAGATAANVMADIVAILTGTTDVNTLSAACNKTTSSVISTNAAGWTVHDSAAGSGAQVLKAPFADASGYKYAWLNFTATGYEFRISEAWNASTHAATNSVAPMGGSASTGYSLSSGGTIFLFAAATYLHMLCFTGSTYGSLMSTMERTRASLWDTSAVGVPPFVCAYGSSSGAWNPAWNAAQIFGPRTKDTAFADITGTSAKYFPVSLWGNGTGGGSATYLGYYTGTPRTCDTTGTPQYVVTDVYCASPQRGDLGGQLYGVKQVSVGGNTSDDVAFGGQTYFYVSQLSVCGSAGSGPCLALPKF